LEKLAEKADVDLAVLVKIETDEAFDTRSADRPSVGFNFWTCPRRS
jgi:hypothetical protein